MLPPLDSATVADEDDLATAVDAFIREDPDATERLTEIALLRDGLLAGALPAEWENHTNLHGLMEARFAELGVALVRWGFDAGARSAR